MQKARKYKILKNKQSGFTFVELIVATTISGIILIFILSFVSGSLSEISYSIKHSKALISYNQLFTKLNNYRNIFLSGSILIDNPTGSGNDILMLHNSDKSQGVIFGVVDKKTMKLEQNSNYPYYYEKIIGYRTLSSSEITELYNNPNNVYNYNFYEDSLFSDLKMKDFQLELYNSGTIFQANIQANLDYKKSFVGQTFSSIGTKNINTFNLNF